LRSLVHFCGHKNEARKILIFLCVFAPLREAIFKPVTYDNPRSCRRFIHSNQELSRAKTVE